MADYFSPNKNDLLINLVIKTSIAFIYNRLSKTTRALKKPLDCSVLKQKKFN